MIKVGVIGYGVMGSMLIEAFIKSNRIRSNEIIVSTRTKTKLDTVKQQWEDIHIASDNKEVAREAKFIFLCVKPLEVKEVLLEIQDYVSPNTNIISIAGPVPIKFIVDTIHTKVTKLTPSLTSFVMDGISLMCHTDTVTSDEADFIEYLLNGISRVKKIKEPDFELAILLTSCMPGYIASIFQEFSKAALRQSSKLSIGDIEEMLVGTISGTSKLFSQKNMTFEDTIQRVAVKGGITDVGVKIFEKELPEVFHQLFHSTLEKRRIITEKVERNLMGEE
jgi:pyrroline-5-carboxylate reductase